VRAIQRLDRRVAASDGCIWRLRIG
jgi:hypothetical protein